MYFLRRLLFRSRTAVKLMNRMARAHGNGSVLSSVELQSENPGSACKVCVILGRQTNMETPLCPHPISVQFDRVGHPLSTAPCPDYVQIACSALLHRAVHSACTHCVCLSVRPYDSHAKQRATASCMSSNAPSSVNKFNMGIQKFACTCFGHYWRSSQGLANTTNSWTYILNIGCHMGTFANINKPRLKYWYNWNKLC
jgi:hypothetical protein